MLKNGFKRAEICLAIGKDKSTLSRELKRNSSKNGYFPKAAQENYEIRKERLRRPRKCNENVKHLIMKYLTEEQLSPEQIVGFCKKEKIEMVSVEKIYQIICADKRAGGDLWKNCRHKLKHRKRPVGGKKIIIPNKISIDERPEIINERGRFGDFEIDLIVGKNNRGAVLTIVERQSRFLIIEKLPDGKNAKSLSKILINSTLPYKEIIKSFTSDNGTEFFHHEEIAANLDADYFFCHPYSSWERGTIENTNGLIRQYIPKNQSLTDVSEKFLKEIQYKINRRPRKILNFETPKIIFFQKVNEIYKPVHLIVEYAFN